MEELEMSHSLLGADCRTHCKIVAVALAGSMSLIMLSIAARPAETKAPPALTQANVPLFKAGAETRAPIIR
jgi:hypothetical protein